MKYLLIGLLLLPLIYSSKSLAQGYGADPKTFVASSPVGGMGFTNYTAPTDICTLTGGSDGSTTFFSRVYRIKVSGLATSATTANFFLVKRSNADTGTAGTSTQSMSVIPLDSKKTTSYATATYWVGAPNPVGTAVGTFDAQAVPLQAKVSGASTNAGFIFDYGPTSGLGPIRLYNGEQLALNFNGVFMPSGASLYCQFFWTEGGPQSNP